MTGLPLLYEDGHLLALDKPAGMLTVPGRGADKQDCLWTRVRDRYPDALVVHRLDQATSGLCLFARGAASQRALAIAFAQRQVHKQYLALVAGRPARHDAGDAQGWQTIDLPLAADWPRRPRQQVDFVRGRPSQTLWRLAPPGAHPPPRAGSTRLELQPVTGRSHQLRVHLLAIGHPVLGDRLYASAPWDTAAPRLMLHAAGLQFPHPSDGRPLRLLSAAPF